eukprot:SAG31_NODE_2252_length_6076_cov_2.828342_2_plen_97_part_00
MRASCKLLQQVAADATKRLKEQGVNYTIYPADFSGIMIQGGFCVGEWTALLEAAGGIVKPFGDALLQFYGNKQHTATRVTLSTELDPFSKEGQKVK